MRTRTGTALICALLLTACHHTPVASPENSESRGRFTGIGIFDVGHIWAQMAVSGKATDPAAATIADDEHVIVVLDSRTGEIRQCGDHSGTCVTMNPWTRPGTLGGLPVKLTKHMSELQADARETTAVPLK